MSIKLADNIQVQTTKPVDSKYLYITVPYSGETQVNSTIPSDERHPGLTVNINNDEWWYKDGVLNGDLVQKSLGGTSNLSGATNGLSLFSGDTYVGLGGGLTDITNITISGTTSLTITDSRATKIGIEYGGDYESSFTCRSLVTAQYVTGSSNIVSVYNQTSTTTYSATTTNDFIGAWSGSTIYLPNSPNLGQRISVADISSGALSCGICICSDTLLIVGSQSATINTDYGSITFINNGNFWSTAAFIN